MTMILLFLLACGPRHSTPPAVEAPIDAPATLPTPYTAEQIRAAMPVGTTLRLSLSGTGPAPVEQRWRVTAADEAGCTIASTIVDPQTGAVLVDEGEGTSAWTELRDHAAFPAAFTTTSTEDVDLPTGHIHALVYVVKPPDGPTRTFWFDPEHPGPPARMVVAAPEGGAPVEMIILERGAP